MNTLILKKTENVKIKKNGVKILKNAKRHITCITETTISYYDSIFEEKSSLK